MNTVAPLKTESPSRKSYSSYYSNNSSASFYSANEVDLSVPPNQLYNFTQKSSPLRREGTITSNTSTVRGFERHTNSSYDEKDYGFLADSSMAFQQAPSSFQQSGIQASTGIADIPQTRSLTNDNSNSPHSVFTYESMRPKLGTAASPISIQSRSTGNENQYSVSTPRTAPHPYDLNNSSPGTPASRSEAQELSSLNILSHQEIANPSRVGEPGISRLIPVRDFNTLSYTSRAESDSSSAFVFEDSGNAVTTPTEFEMPFNKEMGQTTPDSNSSQRKIRRVNSSPLTIPKEKFPTIFNNNNADLPVGTSGAFRVSSRPDSGVSDVPSSQNDILPSMLHPAKPFMPHVYRMNAMGLSQQENYREDYQLSMPKRTYSEGEKNPSDNRSQSRSSGATFTSASDLEYQSQAQSRVADIRAKNEGRPANEGISESTGERLVTHPADTKKSIKAKGFMMSNDSRTSLFTTRSGTRQLSVGSGMLPPVSKRNPTYSKTAKKPSISSMSSLIDTPEPAQGITPIDYMRQKMAGAKPIRDSVVTNNSSVYLDAKSGPYASLPDLYTGPAANEPASPEESLETRRIRRELDFVARVNQISTSHYLSTDEDINATVLASKAFNEDCESDTSNKFLAQSMKKYDKNGNHICNESTEIFVLITFLLCPPLWLLLSAGLFDIVLGRVSRKTKLIALCLSATTFFLVIAAVIVGITVGT